jgi:uncharacterized protein YndB with AHSA1/START domain
MTAATQPIRWQLHLKSSPEHVYDLLATDAGRARFWAESATERDGEIEFVFPNGLTWRGAILIAEPPCRYGVRYFGGSITTFSLDPDGDGGTDLTIIDAGVPAGDWQETHAGWLSVLLAIKAAADFGIDLRNHDPNRTWDQGYVDN